MQAAVVRRVAHAWVEFWDRREAPTSLALTRILIGLVVFSDLSIGKLEDAVPDLWAAPPAGMGAIEDPSSWFAARGAALLLWSVALAAAFFVAVGAFYRLTAPILAAALVLFEHLQPTGDGADALLRIVVPVLALSRADAAFSFDAWLSRRRQRNVPREVPAWPRYLLMLQLVWVYSSAAQCRDDTAWWPWGGFAAISNILEDPHFARFSPTALASLYPLTQLGTVATMVFELGAPFALLVTLRDPNRQAQMRPLWRRLRAAWILLGVSLHAGIAVTMTIGIFPYTMVALYPVLFHPDQLAAALAALRRSSEIRLR